jgi:hypothetical protein
VLGQSAQHPLLLLSYQSAQHRPHPLTYRGDTAPHPLPWQGGGRSLRQFCHTCWANCSTCSRLMLPKTAVRDGDKAWHLDPFFYRLIFQQSHLDGTSMQRSQAYWSLSSALMIRLPMNWPRDISTHTIYSPNDRSAVTIPPCDILKLYNASSIFPPQLVRDGCLATCDMISTLVYSTCPVTSSPTFWSKMWSFWHMIYGRTYDVWPVSNQFVEVLLYQFWTHFQYDVRPDVKWDMD